MKKIFLLAIPLLLTGCVRVCINDDTYEYIDLFGNKGTSNYCYIGNRGSSLLCEIGEDGFIQVAEYKLIEDKEVCE